LTITQCWTPNLHPEPKQTPTQARFDRHFVRDLAWSRHQLEELAERRFRAAQEALRQELAAEVGMGAPLKLQGRVCCFA